jgi:hypothetical protein
MSNIVLLDSAAHRKLRVHTQVGARFGDNQRFVTVVVGEFQKLALHYPILLSKDADTGQFYCGAMLGFDSGENLFIDEQSSLSAYRPLNLQRGAFATVGPDLAVDLDHPRISSSGDQELFTANGEPGKYLQTIMGVMRELRPGAERTRIFIDALLGLKLIEAIDISARFDDGGKRELSGLYTINLDELKDLPDAAALDLFRRGYLQLIYLLRNSLNHLSLLVQRKNRTFLPTHQPGEPGPP